MHAGFLSTGNAILFLFLRSIDQRANASSDESQRPLSPPGGRAPAQRSLG
jgi:hypothetical protein